MRTAIVLGGSGLIGGAVVRRLLEQGWRVTAVSRSGAGPGGVADGAGRLRRLAADRRDPVALAGAVGDGAELLVDTCAYAAADADALLPHLAGVDSVAVVSAKAVYVDERGRHLNSPVRPAFRGPIREDAPTMAPSREPFDSPAGYGANKVAIERTLLDSGRPVTVVRPSKVHGVGASPSREWAIVRRVLEGHPVIPVAGGGRGADHPTAAAAVARIVAAAGDRPAARIVNATDGDAPDAGGVVRAIAARLGAGDRVRPLESGAVDRDGQPLRDVGRTPWDAWPPIRLDTSAATALVGAPNPAYAEAVGPAIDDAVARAVRNGDRWRLPGSEGIDAAFVDPDLPRLARM